MSYIIDFYISCPMCLPEDLPKLHAEIRLAQSAVRCVSPKIFLNFTPKYGWPKAPARLRLFPIQAIAPASMDVKPVLTVTGRFTVDFSLAKSIFITTLVQSTAFSVLRSRNRSGLYDPPQLVLYVLRPFLPVLPVFPLPRVVHGTVPEIQCIAKIVQCSTKRVFFPKYGGRVPALLFHRSAGLFAFVVHLFLLSPARFGGSDGIFLRHQ